MKTTLVLLAAVMLLFSCRNEEVIEKEGCTVTATVRDLTGLDGCGFVFELQDGTRLEPLRIYRCGTPPLPEEPADPLLNFTFIDGKKVRIGYEETKAFSICMVGPVVKITCLSEITSAEN